MIAGLQSLLEKLRASGADLGTDFWAFKVVPQPAGPSFSSSPICIID